MDVEALIAKKAFVSVNETNVGLGGNNALESRLCYWHLLTSVLKNNALIRQRTECARGVKFHFTRIQRGSGPGTGHSVLLSRNCDQPRFSKRMRLCPGLTGGEVSLCQTNSVEKESPFW